MSDKRENQRPERSRKMEKSAPEPQTEYLDMDTDEEEFGRQGLFVFKTIFVIHKKEKIDKLIFFTSL